MMIAPPAGPGQPASAGAPAQDPVVRRYRAFFALLDWGQVPERAADRPWPGRPPHPRAADRPWPGRPPHPPAAYVKALLVKLCEGKAYVTHLRAFLVEHPLLVLELGFRPAPDPARPAGFDVERTVPGARWLRRAQQALDPAVLRALLRATVRALQAEVPGLGTTVAVDVKHIYAWVRENNPKDCGAAPHNPARPPRGDPDCRLGAKRRANQAGPAGAAAGGKAYLWGYGTGVASATDPRYGDAVLAEWTQPFNRQDVTYFRPLYEQAVAALGRRPTNLAADAAFDAWHVYQPCAEAGGLAAIPLNRRGQPPPDRDAAGRPRCAKGLAMAPTRRFAHEDGYRAQRYGCPLLTPRPTGQVCDHVRFAKGPGCTKVVNLEPGGQMRAALDRRADAFRAIYRQRTSAERVNSQATALGIERPKVRNVRSVRHLNTLTYIVINVRALQRARRLNAHAPPPHALC